MQENWLPTAQALHPLLMALIDEVAAFILEAQRGFHPGHIEYKGHNNLVSYVDRQAEQMLHDALTRMLPGSGFIGEEGGGHNEDAPYRWIIDPLDGTTNFMHGVPAYAISLALQHHGQTVLGIVRDVPRGETFHTIRGKGAWLGDQPIRVSTADSLGRSLIGMGFPYADSGILLDDYLAVLKDFVSTCHGMRRLGAAAIDLAWVACGRIDGFYEKGLQAWDVAAGALLIHEAGGKASDWSGTDNFVFGRQIVASNGAIHAAMLDVLTRRERA